MSKIFSRVLVTSLALAALSAQLQAQAQSSGVLLPGWKWHPLAEIYQIGMIFPDRHVQSIVYAVRGEFPTLDEADKAEARFLGALAQYRLDQSRNWELLRSVPPAVQGKVGDYIAAHELLNSKGALFLKADVSYGEAFALRRELPADYRSDLDQHIRARMLAQADGAIYGKGVYDGSAETQVGSIKNALSDLKSGLLPEEKAVVDSVLAEIDRRVSQKRELEKPHIPGL